MGRKKAFIAVGIILWGGLVVALYFGVKKPFALQVINPLGNLVWTLIVTSVLIINALALGKLTIRQFKADASDNTALFALAGGIGLGELGLLGFLLAATGASHWLILLSIQIILLSLFAWRGILREVVASLAHLIEEIKFSASAVSLWMKWAAALALTFTFLLTLLPPIDAFDALLYHLTIPELWLREGGIQAHNFPHYWFPGLVEGVYLWGLGLKSEIVPQQIHFAWALFTMILVWSWSRRLWNDLTAWWAVMLIISMPSVLLLASWAYTDLALSFFGVAMLYTLSHGKEQNDTRWWNLSAISAGMAMGVKYTSFVMPMTAVMFIAVWTYRKRRDLFIELLKYIFISAPVASIWYLRSWIWMGNPFYPFVFGGRYWDLFRAAWFANAGSGAGWDLKALLLLPFTITLRSQDINSIDSDIGPLLLLTLPLALWAIARVYQRASDSEAARRISLTVIGLLTLFGTAVWVYGYVTTRNLWQTRLLLPAIVPFVIPAAAGITSLGKWDTRRLRLSFIVSVIAALSISINLFDLGLKVVSRNPLAVSTGLVNRQTYFQRYQPAYADALQMVSETPGSSKIYILFEPRSYGMARTVQPDTILDAFSRDVYFFESPENIVRSWQAQGYSHVLVNKRGAFLVLHNSGKELVLENTLALLNPVSISTNEDYELLEIPDYSP